MGRYLDLMREASDDGAAQFRDRDKSDISDRSHAEVERAADIRVIGGDRSLRSLMSHSQSRNARCGAPDPKAAETSILAVEHLRDAPEAKWSAGMEERAAIVEHDGGIPRAWAEGFARLDPDRPPGDTPPRRWRRFIDDIGQFLDGPFCAAAVALGWGPHDLFGCDRDQPFARIDRAGLLWLLDGDRIAMLADDAATIETRTGARQTYRRQPTAPGRVLAWELAQ